MLELRIMINAKIVKEPIKVTGTSSKILWLMLKINI